MSNQRIPPLDPPFADELQESFDVVMPKGMPPLNIFRTMAHNPRVLSRIVRGGLLDRGSISIAERELVILRACARCRAEYEWGVHVAGFANKAGFTEEQVSNTIATDVDPALWSASQLAILAMVDEFHTRSDLSDETWEQMRAHYQKTQVIELMMLAGLYHAVSFMVNGLRLERETFAARFPG